MNCVGCPTRSRVPTLASLRYPIYLLLLTVSAFARSESYDTDIQFQRILDGSRGDNALGTIGAIAQDEDGFLWLGGTQGLGRYDGHELRMYRSHSDDPYSLSSNYIFDVELDSAGTLWVATDDGLSRYDRRLDRFDVFRSAPGDSASLPDDQVVSLEQDDRRGLLYIGTKAGLAYFDTSTSQLNRTGYQAPINKVHVDDSGRLWVGLYDRGLVQLSTETHDVVASYSMGVGAERDNSLCGNEILDLESDAGGGLWVATLGNGICRFHPDQGRFVMLLDLDHFKRINDTLGHDAGDRVLKEVARVVGGRLRHDDHLGRWGGEEFILICEGTPLEHARHLAETVRARVEEHVFERESATSLPITMSIGLAKLEPGETFDAALKRADEALYKAKRNGRNQVALPN